MSIYQSKKPFLVLSPMDGVTDTAMRQITKKYGQPDLMMTEFVNVEGIHFAKKRLMKEFNFQENEQPLIAQIYGLTPAYFYEATLEVCQRDFFGVDINFGCPAKSVVHSGAGAAMIKTPELAKEIFIAVKQATLDFAQKEHKKPLPVSIKTRLGYDDVNIAEKWLSWLLVLQPDLISVHGRTLKQGYSGEADWEAIGQIVKLRNQISPQTAIFGNGDLKNLEKVEERIAQTSVDGVLIGRAALGNPWVFQGKVPTLAQQIAVAIDHCRVFEQTYSQREKYSFVSMRKHLAAYLSSFAGAREVRAALMQTNSADEVAAILQPLL